MFKAIQQQHVFADLRGVDVYFLGVHAVGKDVKYWQSLQVFYGDYFKACGASLRIFSVSRDMPDFLSER
jgi:hypothetical protein